ncbi:DUF6965 family protein [Chryseobacterium fistulae]|jgi:hypothetical protein|uniref:Uncharacterized protein n=1 Tax=Chryseobacterium fistulae TaxID=2675058 RepID=A0A6N4XS92_9FLAO|nr:DUF6371 domain-containing protein [Chryseobacterium fistulae]CAA7392072.1 hypothetical protein CHRY9393_03034 [Chryseobacterium fistulae]
MSNFSNQLRYNLEKGSKKYHCPKCHKKTLVLYIDTETGDYLPPEYGRCDRESKCSYHLNPYSDGYVKIHVKQQKVTKVTNGTIQKRKYSGTRFKPQTLQNKIKSQTKIVYFDFETFKETLQPERYEKNIFIQNLFYHIPFPFKADEVTKIIQLYRLGTVANGYRAGANTFPFIDLHGKIRAVQVKQFDEANHTTGTDFLHSIIEKYYNKNNKPLPQWLIKYNQNEKKISCLFGEHLLSKYPLNPVALVEAPKTAVYGALYFGLPETAENLIWLAVYNKSSFSFDKLEVLQGRNVFIFPDLSENGNTFKEWETKAKYFESQLSETRFILSELLEHLAPDNDKNSGYDLADYLIKQDWRLFRKQKIKEKTKSESDHEYQFDAQYLSAPQKITTYAEIKNNDAKRTKINEPEKPLLKTKNFISANKKQVEKRAKKYPEIWSKDISDLEIFFFNNEFPNTTVQLNSYSIISDVPKFIKSHLSVVKANNGNPTFSPYLSRLQQLRQVLTIN